MNAVVAFCFETFNEVHIFHIRTVFRPIRTIQLVFEHFNTTKARSNETQCYEVANATNKFPLHGKYPQGSALSSTRINELIWPPNPI